ncbi:hypothetical protein AR454_16605 [Bacillus mycoides]|nr:hypothetical protein [Bacillus mycoides]
MQIGVQSHFGSGGAYNSWPSYNGSWYYFVGTKMQTGWVRVNGTWYYLDKEGLMVKGKVMIYGKVCDFDKSGVLR